MIIGKRIKNARTKKGLTQEELGKLLGVSKVSICGYERGTRTPTMENFLDLIEILEVEPDYLLGRDTKTTTKKNSNITIIAEEDMQIIKEIKNNRELYNLFCTDPKKTIELITRKTKK